MFAHPDDESLWCGGRLSEGDWAVICCSVPDKHPNRAWRFFEACEVLGVKGKILPWRESEGLYLEELDLDEYDEILTHGEAGEYGHRHHVAIHKHIKERWGDRAEYIGYGVDGAKEYPLSREAQEKKRKAIEVYNRDPYPKKLISWYGPKYDLWTERYCRLRP